MQGGIYKTCNTPIKLERHSDEVDSKIDVGSVHPPCSRAIMPVRWGPSSHVGTVILFWEDI
jgi:hypothetical protein